VNSGPQILDWLRTATEPLSGAELARRLGCSRAAVWKQVRTLRARGFDIQGRPARGYVLAAEPTTFDQQSIEAALHGRWRRIAWYPELDTTQRTARELADGGAPEGTVVVADRQRRGRGRLGRQWQSPAGVNLYCTILLRPSLAPAIVPQLALVGGLAVADAVTAELGTAPALKWPNDVLIGGRKVAGILTEMQAELERVRYVLMGIGVNVNQERFPASLGQTATSLARLAGRPIDRARFTARLLAALEARYGRFVSEGLASMRRDWESLSCLHGRTVRVTVADHVTAGRVVGLDEDGALLIAGRDGEVTRVTAGEVTLRREATG